jgi:hypothetical protein
MLDKLTRRSSLTAFAVLPLALLISPAMGDVMSAMDSSPRLAIGGYDTVSYHTRGEAVPGNVDYQTIWHDARWQFSSKENLDLFTKDPEKYAAQYDGHCAMGVSIDSGHKSKIDPQAWAIVDGKLYVNYNKHWADEFLKNTATNISRADANWPVVKNMPEPK